MPMLSRHRRYMGMMVAGIFALLLLSNLIPDPLGRFKTRVPIAPEWSFVEKAQAMLTHAGEFVQDNFGFRASLPVLRRELRAELGSPDTRPIYEGRRGHLFWGRELTPEQSAGAVLRRGKVARFMEVVGEMKALLPPSTQIVVAIPPNAQSVDVEGLPAWTEHLTYPEREYDLVLRAAKALGVTAVDLRAELRKRVPYPRYKLTDTHWNTLSSVEGFNAVMEAIGHPGWQLDPAKVLGTPKPPPVLGDLLRSMRMPPEVKDDHAPLELPMRDAHEDPRLPGQNVFFGFRSKVYPYGGDGPRVLILGDSFTARSWPRMFVNSNVSEVGWMHASHYVLGSCDFDFRNVKLFKPDIVIMARTERLLPCSDNDWPEHLPKASAAVVETVTNAMKPVK